MQNKPRINYKPAPTKSGDNVIENFIFRRNSRLSQNNENDRILKKIKNNKIRALGFKINLKEEKNLSSFHKLYISNPNIFATLT